MKKIVLYFIFNFISTFLYADQLKDALIKGLAKSFDIKEQMLKVEQVRNLKINAYAQLLPTLNLSSSRSYYKSQSINHGVKTWSKSQDDALTMSADWTIWNNFQNITDIKLAKINEEVELGKSKNAIQNYILNVVDSFLTYQLYYNKKRSTELLLAQSQKALDEANLLVSHGSKTKIESINAEIDIINAQRDLLELNNNIETSKRSLMFLLNEQELEIELREIKISDYVPFYYEKFKEKFKDYKVNWKESISLINPDVKQSKLEYESAALKYSQEKLAPWPSLTLSLADSMDFSSFTAKNINHENKAGLHKLSVTFNLTWQLWNWWATPRNALNSYKDFQISQIKFRENQFKISNEMQNLIEQFELLESSIKSSKLILEKANKNFEFANTMYKYGKISLLERQNAMNQLYDAKNAYEERLKNQFLSAGKFLIAIGEEILPSNLY